MISLRRLPTVIRSFTQLSSKRHSSDLFEPNYLDSLKPKIPLYEAVNLQIRGHDYAVLESFQKFIHNLAKNIDCNVEDAWAIPATHMQITTYKPSTELVHQQVILKTYERNVQVTDVSSTQLPILLRAVEASLPEGVSFQAVFHADYHDEARYIPDKELLQLKQELEDMGGSRKTK